MRGLFFRAALRSSDGKFLLLWACVDGEHVLNKAEQWKYAPHQQGKAGRMNDVTRGGFVLYLQEYMSTLVVRGNMTLRRPQGACTVNVWVRSEGKRR